MMLYKNTKAKVRSPDGDTDYFDIVAGLLQGDTLAPYLFIIWLDFVLRTSIDKMKDNGFKLAKERSRRYPVQTITDADYADDTVLLANTPAQAEILLHSLEQVAAGINTQQAKVWAAIDRLSIISKSNLTDKIKRSFFQAAVVLILLYRCTTWTLKEHIERNLDGNYTEILRAILNLFWREHPTKQQMYGQQPPTTKIKLDEPDIRDTAGEVRTNL